MNEERCSSCGQFIDTMSAWYCDECDKPHHEDCSGDNGPGTGEYPDEDAYSICQKCTDDWKNKNKQRSDK